MLGEYTFVDVINFPMTDLRKWKDVCITAVASSCRCGLATGLRRNLKSAREAVGLAHKEVESHNIRSSCNWEHPCLESGNSARAVVAFVCNHRGRISKTLELRLPILPDLCLLMALNMCWQSTWTYLVVCRSSTPSV